MGEVFFAWAYGVARTRKPVVVKVLRGEMLAEPGAPEMFVEEGRLSLRLSHSNILQVFDFGKADDRYFMAMEYVDGYHLGELRKRNGGRLSPEAAAFITMEVCLALDYAHRLKDDGGAPLHIVHRDVTPSNVLVSREGEVKLADFGIARSVGRSQHTQAGQIRGKVRYMAPEAARGEPLDHRADLFSLGAILFELLTGQRAFEGKGREAILQQVVGSRVPPPSSVASDLPAALDDVVVKATAPKREERFPDAFAFHRALEKACQKAGLSPSRGSFLEFLRELETLDPPTDESVKQESAPVRSATPRSGKTSSGAALPPDGGARRPPDGPLGRVTPAGAPPNQISLPTPASAAPASGRGGVAPQHTPNPGATAAVPPPAIHATPGAEPGASGLKSTGSASKPSSQTGSVPPAIKGPDTALPTGVASPLVLFTLTVAGELTPDFRGGTGAGGAEPSLPLFEVTKGEGVAVDFRDVERITPKGEQDAIPRPDDDREFSQTPEPLFPDRPSNSAEATVVREPTPMPLEEPADEATVPPQMARSRSGSALFEVPVDVPLEGEETKAPTVAIPSGPSNEPTVAPSGSGAGSAAAETEIRMRPSLDEPAPTLASGAGAAGGSISESGSRSVSISVSARSVRARTASGRGEGASASRGTAAERNGTAARAVPSPADLDPVTADTHPRATGEFRATSDSRDTIDHVSDAPDDPPPHSARAVVKLSDPIDASGRWRRRGEMPAEPEGQDYPALRQPSRTPLMAGAILILVMLLGWLGSQIFASGDGEPAPRPTPFKQGTPRILEPPPATSAVIAQTPAQTPAHTPVVTRTPVPATPTRTAVAWTPVRATPTPPRATPTPKPTAVASQAFGFLVINSQPWSEVRLGGKLLGNTPLKNVKLPAGRHTLVFRNPVSGLEKQLEVEVVANETKPVLVELK